MGPIPLLFLVSGVPALLYQIVWQRMLFAIFGTNIESVTLVVAGFMLGLGLGSLAGGRVSGRLGRWCLPGFAVAELLIGLMGLASPAVFGAVEARVHGLSLAATGVLSFTLVVAPTLLMGATLPLLTEDLVARTARVGRSVGWLYGLNTLGSALACVLAAEWAMGALGMTGVVRLAAGLNLAVAAAALGLAWRLGPAPPTPDRPAAEEAPRRLGPAMLVTGLAGLVTLSHEILWVRVLGYATMGSAKAFPWVLALFLAGIAAGALAVRPLAARAGRATLLAALAATVTVAWLGIPATARMVTVVEPRWALGWVFLGAALWGAILPLFAGAFVGRAAAGPGLARLYAANIVGAVAGTLLTGFVALQVWPLRGVATGLAVLGLLTATAALAALGASRRQLAGGLAATLVLGGGLAAVQGPAFDGLWERLYFKEMYRADPVAGNPPQRFTLLRQNRHGVVGVTDDGLVVGNGAYDGTTNLDPLVPDTRLPNHIHRAYALSFLHPAPKRVLMIGLSMGAWAQVIAHHPQVEELVVVEINPGYLDLIPEVPRLASLLDNPKVRIHVDDGRRWLRGHPEERFDMVVMNATFNWRQMASALLSKDFLAMVRPHLTPGGVVFYNSTFSPEVRRTALESFPHVLLLGNFLAASDAPLDLDRRRWLATLRAYRIDGRPVVDTDDIEAAWKLQQLQDWYGTLDEPHRPWWGALVSRRKLQAQTRSARVITDDNMGTEWTGGAGLGSFWRHTEVR